MTRERYDHRDPWTTRDRLSARYETSVAAAEPIHRLWAAVTAHAEHAANGGDEYTTMTPTGEIHYPLLGQTFPRPTPQDLLDGLTLVDETRYHAERRELDLIDAAVAAGIGWQQIGVALGHTAATAVRAAKARRAQLARLITQHETR
ncbi:hypothetical protein SAMN05421812_1288 [Asanoa hainanensis]|uniref:Uncharacterized protein n=1 Tax=Asanoa hainanensis TaxID=560556 RepID=A0A239PFR4_9ACTN|nr:hypothetical protein [Asanoa hainanensis]SNT65862.1 hypothetical protein SAMN05421812_1288 [Asanoa hainanensis]